MGTNVGILGLGLYLPPEVRGNDWWSPEVVARWKHERAAARRPSLPEHLTEGQRRVLEAMKEQAIHSHQGATSRHVLPDGMTVLDMEEQAARTAIERAKLAPQDIDLLLTSTIVPEFLLSNPACALHQRLGLPKACFSMHIDIATYSFMMQLTLAEAMIASGRARHALLVQSCAPSRLVDMNDPIAPLFGDAATAVVVGPVSEGRGILASVHFTDGRFPRTLIASVPGGAWYDEGRPMIHVGDEDQVFRAFLDTIDVCKESVDTALAQAELEHDEVAFFCIHQGTPWLRNLAQEHASLKQARTVETFARTAYVFASTLPAGLALAEADGQLHEKDIVVLTGGGPGMTYGASVIKWGA